MAYVVNFLNLTNYYKVTSSEGDQSEYLVPFPPGYTSTMTAYWTTDVIILIRLVVGRPRRQPDLLTRTGPGMWL